MRKPGGKYFQTFINSDLHADLHDSLVYKLKMLKHFMMQQRGPACDMHGV